MGDRTFKSLMSGVGWGLIACLCGWSPESVFVLALATGLTVWWFYYEKES